MYYILHVAGSISVCLSELPRERKCYFGVSAATNYNFKLTFFWFNFFLLY